MQIDEGNFNAQLEDHLRRNATVERDATTDKSKGGQSQRFKPISIYGNDITNQLLSFITESAQVLLLLLLRKLIPPG